MNVPSLDFGPRHRHDSSQLTAVVRNYDPKALLQSSTETKDEIPAVKDDADTEVSKETLVDAWVACVPSLLVELRSILAARIVPMRTGLLLAHVDGQCTVAEIVAASGAKRDEVVQTFMRLEADGLIRVG